MHVWVRDLVEQTTLFVLAYLYGQNNAFLFYILYLAHLCDILPGASDQCHIYIHHVSACCNSSSSLI